ncbi:putative serine protease K12H4.7 [Trichechus inunguis]
MARALGKLLLLLLLLLSCSCAQSFLWRRTRSDPLNTTKHPTDGWFVQKLDHFSQKDSPFWQQRYFINDDFHKPGGPVFLMIGGEAAANRNWISRNYAWITYAQRLGALCLFLEHRFYGHSQPTGDLSTASLHSLNSRQALADIVNFRTEIAKQMGLTKNKWVAFGGSYAGSLAVWSRVKHPNLFAAAVGSSAPIQATVNFYEYFEAVHRILTTHNSECAKTVKEAIDKVVEMLKLPKYYRKLTKHFMLCDPLKIHSEMDRVIFLERVMVFFAFVVQKNKGKHNLINVDNFCDTMNNTSLGSPYYRYRRITNLILKHFNMPCLDANYNDTLEVLSDSSIDEQNPSSERQWLYQCCTEFGFFQTTDSRNQPFSGIPLRYFIKRCSDVFGPKFNYVSLTRNVMATNVYYGGFNVKGSKIIFPSGSIDPWHPLGITKDISKDLPAVIIKGEAHCKDMNEQTDNDSAELIQAREKIFQILQKWLK